MFSGISKKEKHIRSTRPYEIPRTEAHQRRFPLALPPEPPDIEVLPNGNQRYAMNNHRYTTF